MFSQFARTGRAEANTIKEKQKKATMGRILPAADCAERRQSRNTFFGKRLIPPTPQLNVSHSLFSVPLPAKSWLRG
jgi:hypothetical protein